jgi:hypothetical protein
MRSTALTGSPTRLSAVVETRSVCFPFLCQTLFALVNLLISSSYADSSLDSTFPFADGQDMEALVYSLEYTYDVSVLVLISVCIELESVLSVASVARASLPAWRISYIARPATEPCDAKLLTRYARTSDQSASLTKSAHVEREEPASFCEAETSLPA